MARREELIARRKALGYSQERLAELVGVNPATLGRWERGQASPQGRQLNRLADALQVSLNQLNRLLDGEAGQALPAINGVAVPHHMGHYAALERAAGQIDIAHQIVVPGLLQTRDYMTTIMRANFEPLTERQVADRVNIRLARQQVLARTEPPFKLRCVIDESVLHRFAGPDDILADQLDHLVALARRPTIEIRIVPIRSHAFFSADFPFTLVYGIDSEVPYLALTEDSSGAHYRDMIEPIDTHTRLFEHLWHLALSSRESIRLAASVRDNIY